jgi:excisionase family DNA binding protein
MITQKGRVLDVEQACELLNVSRRWLIREGIRKHKIPFLRPPNSNQIRFLESDLWRVLELWRENDEVGTPPVKERPNSLDRRPPRTKKGNK